ncbi:general odorant-binding protein 72-like [Nymphalis io]|uniref:general odorant-binding protein 72-like n=1 Tax=Inachis io TaxID=171585 RepID=UPI0021693166|nr:general odorant-binding protein 72-like [Nymphalis io]
MRSYVGSSLSKLSEMDRKDFSLLIILIVLASGTDSMTRQQLKNSSKMLKKNCMGKNDVTEDLVGDIEKGKFIQDKNVMCYIACIYQMSQIVKNNKLNYEASIKQVDIMFPVDMKDAMKSSIEKCKDISKKYKDICEASYWTAKCIYEDNPKNFVFP